MDKAGLDRNPLSGLRVILFAGEVMPPREAARLRAVPPHAAALQPLRTRPRPTWSTWYGLPENVDPASPVPIGRPCPYARVRLEPGRRRRSAATPRPALLLVAGESLMSGTGTGPWKPPGPSRSYDEDQGAPATTAPATVSSWTRTVELLFAGRADRQLKRRGYRIELGEIEAALASHPDLAEVAVSRVGRGLGAPVGLRQRAGAKATPSELELRAHCARLLPPYMIPDRFLSLQEMPRGNRGKIDYTSLLAGWTGAPRE